LAEIDVNKNIFLFQFGDPKKSE